MQNSSKNFLARIKNLLLLCPLFLIQEGQQPIDNLSIFNNMASTVAQKTIDRLSPDSTAAIIILSQSQEHAGNWLVENWFVKNLYQRGISKIYLEKLDSTRAFTIQFKIDTVGIEYFPTHNHKFVERRFKLSLAVRALEGSPGLVKFYQEFKENYVDKVKFIDLKRLENGDFPFTQAELPAEKGLKRYIEPLIVMSTTAAIVYLFFRLRSN